MLVLDANILIRAVLGQRVMQLLVRYGGAVQLFSPESAFAEAAEHLPAILLRQRVPVPEGMAVLNAVRQIVQAVNAEAYSEFEQAARQRLAGRDLDDWPVLATALALNCPIWTEDSDFFGTGIATWTTGRVELFLHNAARY